MLEKCPRCQSFTPSILAPTTTRPGPGACRRIELAVRREPMTLGLHFPLVNHARNTPVLVDDEDHAFGPTTRGVPKNVFSTSHLSAVCGVPSVELAPCQHAQREAAGAATAKNAARRKGAAAEGSHRAQTPRARPGQGWPPYRGVCTFVVRLCACARADASMRISQGLILGTPCMLCAQSPRIRAVACPSQQQPRLLWRSSGVFSKGAGPERLCRGQTP